MKKVISLETCPDLESRSLLLRAGDLKARFKLLDLSEAAYEYAYLNPSPRAWRAAAILMHAMDYLKDRLAYELFPPPSKFAVKLQVEEPK